MNTTEWYAGYINKAVSEIKYPAQPAGLYEPIAYTLASGGKRLRPMLVLAACEACGGDAVNALHQALGIEMYHNFTLLHDDVMDRADVRRGRPTVHVRWNDSTAILSGDAMLTMAGQLMMEVSYERILRPVMELFNTTAMEIYEGQQYDMDFEKRADVTIEEYLEMIRLKTSVLLGASCKLGALVAGAPSSTADRLYEYGVMLGLAFQLQDDYLDTFGDPAVFGKAIGGDILNDKKTYLLISALQCGDDVARSEIESMFGTRSEEKIRRVRELYVQYGIDRMCRDAIDRYSDLAEKAVAETEIPEESKKFFIDLARKSSSRHS
ncbi:polyprenyl synthetase family protein [uncultured Muribaculum sp.]|uniref:polyprenyl synthetase family protein n=1 Tax=uncultured Muribaculum sp. TaxID=1918613 RepID=UPI0025E0E215|nr:polyprenyl synthetase family protein [uncultured Muribaculum sp.]